MTEKHLQALEIEQLTVNYDKTPVLWDIHLSIPAGKMVGIIGPNGAGKSTLLKVILGILRPLSGSVRFFGKTFKEMRKRIAYVPQRSSVDWSFPITALDLVLMGRYGKLGLLKWPRAADKDAARCVLERVGMLEFAKRQISELSGGQQQRLFIARALIQDADLYFMDEPLAGVDMASEQTIFTIFHELKKKKKTLCVVHHDLTTVDRYFDWGVLLNTSLIASGPLEKVFTTENIMRTYGGSHTLLDEVAKLTKRR
jgi:manganese/zinc/iron transport system ATP- binding protein